jgi:hypothetical protein
MDVTSLPALPLQTDRLIEARQKVLDLVLRVVFGTGKLDAKSETLLIGNRLSPAYHTNRFYVVPFLEGHEQIHHGPDIESVPRKDLASLDTEIE